MMFVIGTIFDDFALNRLKSYTILGATAQNRIRFIYDFRRFHVAWLWDPANVMYDFTWCHNDFMWHDFGSPPMSCMTSHDVMTISYDIVLPQPTHKSYMISYDFRLDHVWLCGGGSMMSYEVIMTSSWHHVVPASTAQPARPARPARPPRPARPARPPRPARK